MARGSGVRFLGGALTGAVAATLVVGAMSVMAPPPVAPQVSDAAPDGVSELQPVTASDSGKTASQTDAAVSAPSVTPQTIAPDPDSTAAIDSATQETAALPQAGAAEALDSLAPSAESTEVPEADAPVQTGDLAAAPAQPQADAQAEVSTDPAPAPVADATDATDEAALAGNETLSAPASDETPAETAPQSAEAETQAAPSETAAEQEIAQTPVSPAEEETPAADPAPQEAEETDVATAPDVPQISDEATPEADPEAETETTPEDTVVASARPAVGTPANSLLDRDTGVTINRPQDTDTTEADAGETTLQTALTEADSSARPIDRFAQPFDAAADKPLMSIVLIDDGTTPTAGAAGIAALRSFPYPLSFAVDSSLPDAAERIALYRDKGFEVMTMIDLPAGAQPVDAETTFAVLLPKMEGVVGVLEGTGTGFQESRDLADQVSAIVAQSGHGLLTQSRGLNTMPKLARKEGVPAAPVFRDFDSKGQSATVIRRFLDQAAFKAGQEGAVVMLGRMRPDTISALLLWGLQDRASSVALSPVSAVLKREP